MALHKWAQYYRAQSVPRTITWFRQYQRLPRYSQLLCCKRSVQFRTCHVPIKNQQPLNNTWGSCTRGHGAAFQSFGSPQIAQRVHSHALTPPQLNLSNMNAMNGFATLILLGQHSHLMQKSEDFKLLSLTFIVSWLCLLEGVGAMIYH